jgi:hypothetical protein
VHHPAAALLLSMERQHSGLSQATSKCRKEGCSNCCCVTCLRFAELIGIGWGSTSSVTNFGTHSGMSGCPEGGAATVCQQAAARQTEEEGFTAAFARSAVSLSTM